MNNFTKSLVSLAAVGTLVLPGAATASGAPALLMKCQSVSVRDTHGGAVRAHTQLTPIRHGRVLTLDPATGVTAQTPFRRNSGRWVSSRNGARYAVANQWISPTGRIGGELLIATRPRPGGKIPCAARRLVAFKSDTASSTADGSLIGYGYVETVGSTTNVSDRPLENYATRTVWTNMPTHPDGAPRSPQDTTPGYPYGYTGMGAAMNDENGTERDAPAFGGLYIDDPYHRHFIIYNGATVAAAKRPNTRPDGTVIVNSTIAWRTVNKNANIAN